MRKRLQIALMASPVLATFLSLTTPYLRAQAGFESITTSVDSSGRKIYVNDEAPAAPRRSAAPVAQSSGLAYWSITEHRWKAVPSANMRAARSAAAEVSTSQQVSTYVRGTPFTQAQIDAAIELAASRHNVDPGLVRAVIKVESNFNPNAVSRTGAMGLMQLMPQTARQLNVVNPFDPQQNVDAGVRHLKKLMENYGGDVRLTLAAYNAGAGAVARSAGIPRFRETRNYVTRITRLYYGGAAPGYQILSSPVHEPVRMKRDDRGVLSFSNTD
jgi:soluble lytic murein transglycosylase-like protein